MKQITKVATGALLASALLLTGCSGGGSSNEGSTGRTDLNVVVPAQPDNLDPHISTIHMTAMITRPVFETLLTVDADGEVQPMLAESFDRSDDGLTYTFALRPGVEFHDGSAFDAADVVASMERWQRLTSTGQTLFADATWTALDPETVQLTVPSASFLHLTNIANRLLNAAVIMPSEVLEQAGDDPVTDIIGTGPYTFGEWVPDQSITIEKWADYQAIDGPTSGLAGDKTGKLEKITFDFVSDPSTRALGLQSGQYDLVTEVPYDGLAQITEDPNLVTGKLLVSPQNLVYSSADGPLANSDMRQAINMALDRDEIMTAAVGDPELYELTHHQMVRDQENVWNTDVGRAGFNPVDVAGAQKLMKQAGYSGEPLTLLVTRDYTEAYNAAVVIQDQLKEAGVPVELEAMEWASYIDRYLNDPASYDFSLLPDVTRLEPSQTIGFVEGRPGYIESDRLSALLTEYRALPTIAEAQTFYDELQQYIEDERPLTRVGDAINLYAGSNALSDVPVFDSTIVWWGVDFK